MRYRPNRRIGNYKPNTVRGGQVETLFHIKKEPEYVDEETHKRFTGGGLNGGEDKIVWKSNVVGGLPANPKNPILRGVQSKVPVVYPAVRTEATMGNGLSNRGIPQENKRMDDFVIGESLKAMEEKDFSILSRRTAVIGDNNNGNYDSNIVSWDLTTLSNSGQFLDWKNSELMIPLTLSVARTAGVNDNVAQKYIASLKNGNFCILDGIRLTLSGATVAEYTQNMPFRVSYMLASDLTATERERYLQYGYVFEDGLSYTSAAANAAGIHTSTVGVLSSLDGANAGRKKRVDCTTSILPGEDAGNRSTRCSTRKTSYMKTNTATSQVFHIFARIPLCWCHDYFAKAPMSKNSLYHLTAFVNAPITVVGTTEATASAAGQTAGDRHWASSAVTTPYGYNPVQLGSLYVGDASGAAAAGAEILTTTLTIKNADLSICQLHASLVTMSGRARDKYLAQPIKTFNFEEYAFRHITNSDATGSSNPVDILLHSNLSRLRKLLIFPYAVRGGSTSTGPSELLSPWSSVGSGLLSTPATCMRALSNFNVEISGQPVFPTDIRYEHEMHDLFLQGTVNGGVITSEDKRSLVDLSQFQGGYGCAVVDLSRHLASEDDLSRSVSVRFVNESGLLMSYLCFIVYEKTLNVDSETGVLVLGNLKAN